MKTVDEMRPGEKFLTGSTPHMKLPHRLGVVSLITGELNTFEYGGSDKFEPAMVLQLHGEPSAVHFSRGRGKVTVEPGPGSVLEKL